MAIRKREKIGWASLAGWVLTLLTRWLVLAVPSPTDTEAWRGIAWELSNSTLRISEMTIVLVVAYAFLIAGVLLAGPSLFTSLTVARERLLERRRKKELLRDLFPFVDQKDREQTVLLSRGKPVLFAYDPPKHPLSPLLRHVSEIAPANIHLFKLDRSVRRTLRRLLRDS